MKRSQVLLAACFYSLYPDRISGYGSGNNASSWVAVMTTDAATTLQLNRLRWLTETESTTIIFHTLFGTALDPQHSTRWVTLFIFTRFIQWQAHNKSSSPLIGPQSFSLSVWLMRVSKGSLILYNKVMQSQHINMVTKKRNSSPSVTIVRWVRCQQPPP